MGIQEAVLPLDQIADMSLPDEAVKLIG